jgi:RNA polymerase sigma factor (sigma-70 family)
MKEVLQASRIHRKHDARFMSTKGDELIPTRQSLLLRLKDTEDDKSWREFLDTYGPFIYGVAVKSGLTMVEAQEVVQETVISVAKKMPEFTYDPKIGAFKGWLMRLTHWRIKDQLRKRLRDAAVVHPAETSTATSLIERLPDPHGNELERVWDEEWQKNVLDTALSSVKHKVSPKAYQIFDLCAIKRWPLQKVAHHLNVNIAQVYLARHRVGLLVKRQIKIIEKEAR